MKLIHCHFLNSVFINIFIFVVLVPNECYTEYCNGVVPTNIGEPCGFETVDADGNNSISFEEIVKFISKNKSLKRKSLVKYIILYSKTFSQNDFNGDNQLSKFEWIRGGEVVSVLGRLISGKN